VDLWFLCTEILGGKHFLSESLHKPWCDWIMRPYAEQYRMFFAPREHAKTTIFTIGKNIQDILIDQEITIMLGHYKKTLAEKLLRGIRGHFESNANLRLIAPDVCYDDPENQSPVWTRDQIQVKRTSIYQVPTIYCVGKDASATMLHFSKIHLDDIVVEENEGSAFLLQETLEWVQGMEGLLDSRGLHKVDIVGTRWRHGDTYGLMLQNEELRPQIRLYNRAIYESATKFTPEGHGEPDYNEGEPIWKDNPRYGTREAVKQLEIRVGSFRFWSNFMNSPVPKGSAVFNMQDVDIRPMDAVGEGKNIRPKLPEKHPDGRRINYHYYTAVDPNTEESTANDPAVVMTIAIDDKGHFWLARIDRGHPNQSVLLEWILHHVKTFGPRILSVEAIAHQNTLGYWLKQAAAEAQIYIPLRLIKKRTTSKYARIVALQEVTEGQRLHGPNWPMFKPLWDEMTVYTEAAKRDDCLDCLSDIFTYGKPPDESEEIKPEKVKSTVTMDSILGRLKTERDVIVERDSAFDRRGIPMRRRLLG